MHFPIGALAITAKSPLKNDEILLASPLGKNANALFGLKD
jgi:hypothetical protein